MIRASGSRPVEVGDQVSGPVRHGGFRPLDAVGISDGGSRQQRLSHVAVAAEPRQPDVAGAERVPQVEQHRRLPEAVIGLGAQQPAPPRVRPQEAGRPRRAVPRRTPTASSKGSAAQGSGELVAVSPASSGALFMDGDAPQQGKRAALWGRQVNRHDPRRGAGLLGSWSSARPERGLEMEIATWSIRRRTPLETCPP